jgi:hypothetical protein
LSKQTTQVGGKSLYRSSAEQVVPTQFDQDHTSAGWESAGLQYAIRQVRSWSRQVVHGSSDSIGEESRPRVLTAAESRRQGVANYEHRLILGCGSRARWVLLYDHRGHQGEDHQQRPRGRATNLGRTLKTREPRSDCCCEGAVDDSVQRYRRRRREQEADEAKRSTESWPSEPHKRTHTDERKANRKRIARSQQKQHQAYPPVSRSARVSYESATPSGSASRGSTRR